MRLEGGIEPRAHAGGIDAVMRQVSEPLPRLRELFELRRAHRARRQVRGDRISLHRRKRPG
jgi:hypothetical protein